MRNKTIRIILTTFTAFLLFLLPLGGTLIHAQDKGDDAALFERIWTEMNQVEDPDKYFSELPREIQEFMISELSHVEVRVKSIENFEERGTQAVCILVEGWVGVLIPEHVFDFSQTISWAYNGEIIQYIYEHYYQAECLAVGIVFGGIVNNWSNGGVGYEWFTEYHQGKFQLKVGGWVIWELLPHVGMVAYNDGTHFGWGGDGT